MALFSITSLSSLLFSCFLSLSLPVCLLVCLSLFVDLPLPLPFIFASSCSPSELSLPQPLHCPSLHLYSVFPSPSHPSLWRCFEPCECNTRQHRLVAVALTHAGLFLLTNPLLLLPLPLLLLLLLLLLHTIPNPHLSDSGLLAPLTDKLFSCSSSSSSLEGQAAPAQRGMPSLRGVRENIPMSGLPAAPPEAPPRHGAPLPVMHQALRPARGPQPPHPPEAPASPRRRAPAQILMVKQHPKRPSTAPWPPSRAEGAFTLAREGRSLPPPEVLKAT